MELIQQLINGLLQGSLYSLLAIGFTLIFGVLSMMNLAHSEVFMTSGIMVYILIDKVHLPLYAAVPIVLAGSIALGMVIELVSFRPIRRDYHYAPLASTIALGIVISELVVNLSGSDAKSVPSVIHLSNLQIGEVLISSPQMILLLVSLVSMLGLSYIMKSTKLGRSMRALSESETAAKLLGVHVRFVVVSTFVLASLLAAVAGMLYAIRFETVSPFMGTMVGLKGLAVMIIGGLGNIRGAMIGGILMGLLEVMAIALPLGLTEYADAVVWGMLILILLFRPTGLMGSSVQTERV
ncbi:branched-chain amino acid ABC transporter permease [Paenibacillus validus]|uniref:Branched-chain amino acid ABC transporter permease n=1 Tax=Paenibacillus validus TaxID=44253 RepID=A0A7X3CRV5_9BACL|nr:MULTISPECIES: branched-chain amino acid ABC transporter permease [Paenibacillus]MED4602846.1 branched-chain amino acid ABC transporter permease [Paenibacillus validus]MED4607312.1 branched-chain amino acid ABC transporter permease [Paenibacillus validus]MUG69369.1 branched-chain amino acid ABC transporter permease [Paenibacillus validus]